MYHDRSVEQGVLVNGRPQPFRAQLSRVSFSSQLGEPGSVEFLTGPEEAVVEPFLHSELSPSELARARKCTLLRFTLPGRA